MMHHYGAYGFHHHFLGFGLGGIILGVLFWVLFIWLIIVLIRWIIAGREGRGHWNRRAYYEKVEQPKKTEPEKEVKEAVVKPDPEYLRILKERYAKGEINKEEFEQKKIDLGA